MGTLDETLEVCVLVRKRSRYQQASQSRRYLKPRTTIGPDDWAAVQAVVVEHGLREAARRFGVSHETARKIVRRVVR